MSRRRVLLCCIVGVALFVACAGDRVEQTFDGPVKIENVRHYSPQAYCDWTPKPSGYARLVVHDSPKFEITSYCANAEVKQHGPKRLIALYCPTTYGKDFEEWRIFRRLGDGKYLEDCTSKGASPPDLERVPALAEAAPSLIACTYALQKGESGNKYMAARYRSIADALAKADGAQAVAKMLEQTLDEPPLNDPDEDGWIVEAGRLEPAVHAELMARTCRTLERSDSSDIAYARAARLCPLDTEAVKVEALARVKRFGKTDGKGSRGLRGDDAWLWSTAIALRSQPKETGKLLCEHASTAGFSAWDEHSVLVALRASGMQCPAVRRSIAEVRCGDIPEGGCAPDDDTVKTWGSEIERPVPRPHAISFPGSGYQFLCNMKREYDAGPCRSSYDAIDADAASRRDP